jgi:hypothetical protein
MARMPLLVLAGMLAALVACAPSVPAAPTPSVAPIPTTATSGQVTTTVSPTSSTMPTPTPRTTTPSTTTRISPTTAHKKSATHSRAACLRDENECYEPGTNRRCETGGCVDAARGITQADKDNATAKWLKEHPGYCAFGTQGAVGPCDG